jgi:hypothetical protein
MTEKCYKCGSKNVESYCCICGAPLCIYCGRVPDPAKHEDNSDYCIPHYVEAGYADLWEVRWVNPQYGDGNVSVFDTEPDLHPFTIPSLINIPSRWAWKWAKIQKAGEEA